MAVGTYKGVAGLAPRPFALGEEAVYAVYAVYAISSLDTGSPLKTHTVAVYAVYAISSLDTG